MIGRRSEGEDGQCHRDEDSKNADHDDDYDESLDFVCVCTVLCEDADVDFLKPSLRRWLEQQVG